jgi:hypothetical protein
MLWACKPPGQANGHELELGRLQQIMSLLNCEIGIVSVETAREFARDLVRWAEAVGGGALEDARAIYNRSHFAKAAPFETACR